METCDRVCGLCRNHDGKDVWCNRENKRVSYNRRACDAFVENAELVAKAKESSFDLDTPEGQKKALVRGYKASRSISLAARMAQVRYDVAKKVLSEEGLLPIGINATRPLKQSRKPTKTAEEEQKPELFGTKRGETMPARRELTDADQAKLIAVFKESGSVNKAAKAAHIHWNRAKEIIEAAGLHETTQAPSSDQAEQGLRDIRQSLRRDVDIFRASLEEAQKAVAVLDQTSEVYGEEVDSELLNSILGTYQRRLEQVSKKVQAAINDRSQPAA